MKIRKHNKPMHEITQHTGTFFACVSGADGSVYAMFKWQHRAEDYLKDLGDGSYVITVDIVSAKL